MGKKINFYSFHFNRPDFIELQYESFKRFVSEFDEVKFHIVNNASDPSLRAAINREAERFGLNVIRTEVDAPAHLPGLHHATAMNQVWHSHAMKQQGYVVLMDGDLFATKPFSVRSYMDYGNWVVAGARQNRAGIYEYLTPVVMILDVDAMPDKETINWVGVHVNGVALDTGGGFYAYLDSHPAIKQKAKSMNFTWHLTSGNKNLHLLPEEIREKYSDDMVFELFTDSFIHYCRSSNWDGMPEGYHVRKTALLRELLEKTSNGSVTMDYYDQAELPTEYFGWK